MREEDVIVRAMDSNRDKVLLVTGGSRGIGAAIARGAARSGWRVVVNYARAAEAAEAVVREIESAGGSALALQGDVAREEDVHATFGEIDRRFGRIDGLVNNAGGQFRAPMKTISTRGFEAVVRNNLTGGFIFMREVYNRWMEAHGGAIVNIIADIWHGWPEFAHSGAARGGMLTLTETAACEWSASGVRINAVAPGGIISSGFDTYAPEMQAKILDFTAGVPLQRFGTEAEISAAILFLLSPAAAYITGSCVRVDGGTPNARNTWKLEPHDRSAPFEGFHRSTLPDLLKKKPDLQS
jgi:citronellol/citronellal dehydrogenase